VQREAFFHAVWRQNKTVPLLIGALLLLNVVVYFFMETVIRPQVADLERRYIENQALLREGKTGGGAETPWSTYVRLQDEMKTFQSAIPPREKFTSLIEEVFSMARKSGLSIDSVQYKPEKKEGRALLQYDLSFSVAGDYGRIKKFVNLIEQSKRLIAIEEVTLTGDAGAGTGGVSLRIRISTYFRTGAS